MAQVMPPRPVEPKREPEIIYLGWWGRAPEEEKERKP